MKRSGLTTVAIIVSTGMVASLSGASAATLEIAPRPFKAADLKVEINATDGDAGLQFFLDDDAWNEIRITKPNGEEMVDLNASGPLQDYGLTELFSESSEPPFDEFPLAKFKQLFPEGTYVFTGTLIDGTRLRSAVPLTHDFPEGPTIIAPEDGAQVTRNGVVIRWEPEDVTTADVRVVRYQVLVVREDGTRTLSADLGAEDRRLRVPKEFLQSGTEYKAEVLAIEASGNQTLTEVAFTVQ